MSELVPSLGSRFCLEQLLLELLISNGLRRVLLLAACECLCSCWRWWCWLVVLLLLVALLALVAQ
jgi:hypothetical protein